MFFCFAGSQKQRWWLLAGRLSNYSGRVWSDMCKYFRIYFPPPVSTMPCGLSATSHSYHLKHSWGIYVDSRSNHARRHTERALTTSNMDFIIFQLNLKSHSFTIIIQRGKHNTKRWHIHRKQPNLHIKLIYAPSRNSVCLWESCCQRTYRTLANITKNFTVQQQDYLRCQWKTEDIIQRRADSYRPTLLLFLCVCVCVYVCMLII